MIDVQDYHGNRNELGICLIKHEKIPISSCFIPLSSDRQNPRHMASQNLDLDVPSPFHIPI